MAENTAKGSYYNPSSLFSSKLRFFSVGVVAENKPLSKDTIEAVPIELVSLVDGELGNVVDEKEISGDNRRDESYSVNLKASSTIKADWLQFGTNRRTSPDVRRGEQVLLYQFADQDRYYWVPLGMDDHLRRLETVIFAISAEEDDSVELNDKENVYTFEVSSHYKHITLNTTDANGEATTYKCQFNLEDGQFFLEDGEGNSITLDSQERQVQIVNADECQVIMDKEDLRFEVPDKLIGKVDGSADLQVGKDLTAIVSENANLSIEGDLTASVTGDVSGTVGKTIDWQTDGDVKHQAPTMQFGEDSSVQPSVLGDNMAQAMDMLIEQLNNSFVIGNLGAPTSTITAGSGPVEATGGNELQSGGNTYSTKNKNQ